jgi:hypothetical protein
VEEVAVAVRAVLQSCHTVLIVAVAEVEVQTL